MTPERRDELFQSIVEYFANSITSETISEKFKFNFKKTSEILGQAQREREALEIDDEGATVAQDRELDAIVNRTIDSLIEEKN